MSRCFNQSVPLFQLKCPVVSIKMSVNGKNFKHEDRLRIIAAYESGRAVSEIAINYGCNRKTVSRILKSYQSTGNTESSSKGGNRRRILTEIQEQAIVSMIREDCTRSLQSLKNRMEKEHSVSVSRSTIHRRLDEFNFSLKRTSFIPDNNVDERILEARRVYALDFQDWMHERDGNNIFYVDEVGFNASMRVLRGRSPRGERAIQYVQRVRTRNISVCCAMSRIGTFHYQKQTSAFNRVTFKQFILDVIEKMRSVGLQNAIFVMDNVAFHKVEEVREMIESTGHMIKFLPAYSPFLNPIENMFSQWKQLVRAGSPNCEAELIVLIDSVYNQISRVNCNAYFEHMLSFLPRCEEKAIIEDQ
jgi:transposase